MHPYVDLAPRIDTAALPESAEADSLHGIAEFIDPNKQLSVSEQLKVTSCIWSLLGHDVPNLSDDALATMSKITESHPSFRVIPTRSLDRSGRMAVDRTIGARFSFSTKYAHIPWDTPSGIYGFLLEQPNTPSTFELSDGISAIRTKEQTFGLRYRSPSGDIVDRHQFEIDLLRLGLAVHGTDDVVWSFPLLNLSQSAQSSKLSVAQAFQLVNPLVTPETEMITGLLHGIAGKSSLTPGGQLNIVNEAMFSIPQNGSAAMELVDVCSLDRYPGYQEAAFYGPNTRNDGRNLYVSEALNGLGARV
jgi:hypothetical protein